MLSFFCTGWPTWLDNSKILLQGGKKDKGFIYLYFKMYVYEGILSINVRFSDNFALFYTVLIQAL